MGDEVRRTQQGNNNAYCQDNEISWFDWTLLAKHADVHRLVRMLSAQRSLRGPDLGVRTLSVKERDANRVWHGVKLAQPDWSSGSHSIAYTVSRRNGMRRFHVIFNAYWEALDFDLPPIGEAIAWRRWIDTALDSPEDIVEWQDSPEVIGRTYRAAPRSVVVLLN